jgi:hypothetical protein
LFHQNCQFFEGFEIIWVIGISKQIRIKSQFANLIPICFEIEVCSAKGKAPSENRDDHAE